MHLELDKKFKLYMFRCSNSLQFGRGLRLGAFIQIHNAHPVFARLSSSNKRHTNTLDRGMLKGFGLCFYSQIEVIEFSPTLTEYHYLCAIYQLFEIYNIFTIHSATKFLLESNQALKL